MWFIAKESKGGREGGVDRYHMSKYVHGICTSGLLFFPEKMPPPTVGDTFKGCSTVLSSHTFGLIKFWVR